MAKCIECGTTIAIGNVCSQCMLREGDPGVAVAPTMPSWFKSVIHVLDGTGIELHPEYHSDWWFVVDVSSGSDATLSSALPLKQAKRRAEEIAAKRKKRGKCDGK